MSLAFPEVPGETISEKLTREWNNNNNKSENHQKSLEKGNYKYPGILESDIIGYYIIIDRFNVTRKEGGKELIGIKSSVEAENRVHKEYFKTWKESLFTATSTFY